MTVFMPHWPKPIGNRPINFIDLGLDRVLELSSRLGNPHTKIPNIIHVAGTNGKGSTIAFIRKVLEESGYTVHTYTSPHLVYFNERIVVAGQQISDKFLHAILEECRAASDGIKITFFEGTTVAAFLAFSKVKADFTIIETGMGGKLDATNIIEPIISIITSVSFDHTEHLGNTLEVIAHEKSGIIKKGSLSIISKQSNSILKVIESSAMHFKSPVYRFGHEWTCTRSENGMSFQSGKESVEYPRPSLMGEHQIINAGNAIACATILHNKFGYTKITDSSISSALTTTYWPARLEHLATPTSFTGLCDIFLDGAHNIGGAEAIKSWLAEKKVCIILGMTRGKDTVGFLKMLKPNLQLLCAVCVKSEPRSQTTEEIQESASSIGINCTKHDDILSALHYIMDVTRPTQTNKVIIIVCGSLFLAKDLYDLFSANGVSLPFFQNA